MNKPVILLGTGGHARVLLDVLRRLHVEILGATDPNRPAGSEWQKLKILGTDNSVLDYAPGHVELVNGIGSLPNGSGLRERLFTEFTTRNYRFRSVIDPQAFVATDTVLAEGVQIMAGAIIQTGTQIAENCIINSGAIVEHDCRIEAHVHIAPGAVLSGGVTVNRKSHIGTGAVLIQNIRIGYESVAGAGSVVTKDIGDRQIVYPARSEVKNR